MALSNHGLYATHTVFKGTGSDGLLNLLLATLPSTEVKKEIEYCFFLGAVGFSAKSYLSLARMLVKGLVVICATIVVRKRLSTHENPPTRTNRRTLSRTRRITTTVSLYRTQGRLAYSRLRIRHRTKRLACPMDRRPTSNMKNQFPPDVHVEGLYAGEWIPVQDTVDKSEDFVRGYFSALQSDYQRYQYRLVHNDRILQEIP